MTDDIKFALIHEVFRHPLPSDSPPLLLPSAIKTPLRPHQQEMVRAMMKYGPLQIQTENMTYHLTRRIGMLCDGPGTGKSLTVLAFLSMVSPTLHSHPILSDLSSPLFSVMEEKHTEEKGIVSNLIIVPHTLYAQWQSEIKTHTTLSYTSIESKRMIKGNIKEQIQKSGLVLTTNTCFSYVQEYAKKNGIEWKHVVIDEASSTYFHLSDPLLSFEQLWLVTHHWIPLLCKHPSLVISSLEDMKEQMGDIHTDMEQWIQSHHTHPYDPSPMPSSYMKRYLPQTHPLRWALCLRSSYDAVERSMQLPPIREYMVPCRPTITIPSLMSYQLAHPHKILIQSKVIPWYFQALRIPFMEPLLYQEDHFSKRKLIERRMTENECSICMEPCEHPTIVSCCYHLYCGKCILRTLLLSQKCPTCRDGLTERSLTCLSPLREEDRIGNKGKMESCLEILKRRQKGDQFIIYSSFTNIAYQMFESLDKIGITSDHLESNLVSMKRSFERFRTGDIQVLFVSNANGLRGVSLETTSHLIFYHEPPSFEWKQLLLGSAQRLSRTVPLEVIHLRSEIPV